MTNIQEHNSLGPPSNINEYILKTGCAGCDDLPAEAVLFKGKLEWYSSHSTK